MTAGAISEQDAGDVLVLPTQSLYDVTVPDIERVTSNCALPVFAGMFHGLVGPSEVGKTTLAAHSVLDVAATARHVLICDGEMTAATWRRKLVQLGADDDALRCVHYLEMSDRASMVDRMRATAAVFDVRLIVWDSALSLLSRIVTSENDNAAVGKVFDRIRAILKDSPVAGLIVDHSASGSVTPVSRGASAKFAALDVSFGVRLADGSIPGPLETWSSVVSVEKDRHGLLGARSDREATFNPLGAGMLGVDLVEVERISHRLSTTNPVETMLAKLAELDPPPKSANDAHRRLGGTRTVILAAYRRWDESGSRGSGSIEPNRRTSSRTGSNRRTASGADVIPINAAETWPSGSIGATDD